MSAPTTEAPATENSEQGGAEEMTLAELLEQLQTVTGDHLTAGLTAVRARANELRAKAAASGVSADEQTEAAELGKAYKSLTEEQARREQVAQEFSESLDGIPDTEPEQPSQPADEPQPADEQPTEAPAEQPAETQPQPEATTAAAHEPPKAPRLPLGTITRQSPPTVSNTPAGGPVSIVAAAGDRQLSYGQEMSQEQLYEALYNRARSIGRGHGGGEHGDYVTVASIEHAKPAERHLAQHDEAGNSRKIDMVTAPTALTAAGVCAPYTIDYSMDAIGSLARPVKDAFPQYTADRGGVQFRRDVDALGAGPISANGTWTLATDATPGGNTKPIWEVPCNTVVSAEVQAVTLGLKFSNITNRFDPEAVAANTKAAAIAHARYAESLLLNSLYSQVTATFQHAPSPALGATRDLLVAIDKAQAYFRDARRIGADVPLRVILPHWVLNLMRADLARALHTSNEQWLGETDAAIMQWFTNRQINVSWTLDGRAAQSASGTGSTQVYAMAAQAYAVQAGSQTMPTFPDQVEFPMYPEGTFVYLDGGSLDVGVVRDQALVQVNRYIQFQETFEGLYRKGVEAVRVVAGVNPIGGSASTISTSAMTD